MKEYMSERMSPDLAIERLNALGREGWDVISMTWIPPIHESEGLGVVLNLMKCVAGTNVWLVFLKRERAP